MELSIYVYMYIKMHALKMLSDFTLSEIPKQNLLQKCERSETL